MAKRKSRDFGELPPALLEVASTVVRSRDREAIVEHPKHLEMWHSLAHPDDRSYSYNYD